MLAAALRSPVQTYRCENRKGAGYAVLTNAIPAGAFRGFGRTQTTFAIECAIDELAGKLGIDPIEMRRINMVGEDSAGGGVGQGANACNRETYGADQCVDFVEAALKSGRGERKPAGDEWVEGRGIAIHFHERSPPSKHESQADVSLKPDGGILLANGLAEFGNGSMNTIRQIAAQVLGVRAADVETVVGDTDKTPYDGGTFACTGTSVSGKSVELAANALKDRLIAAAARLLGRPVAAGTLIDGRAVFADQSISFAELYEKTPEADQQFKVARTAYATPLLPAFLMHGFRVAANKDTCDIRILQSVHAVDAGVVLNPLQLAGQIEGGIAQGIGSTLFERVVTDAEGNVMNATLRNYRIPAFADIPRSEIFYADTCDPAGPLGAKAMGEAPIIPISAALANAVTNAIGVRMASLPLSADRLYEALYGGKSEAAGPIETGPE